MRPIVSDQNSLRNPLNELLGTEARVRLLRVLATEVDGPLAVPDAAERAGLTIPGTHKALNDFTNLVLSFALAGVENISMSFVVPISL